MEHRKKKPHVEDKVLLVLRHTHTRIYIFDKYFQPKYIVTCNLRIGDNLKALPSKNKCQ